MSFESCTFPIDKKGDIKIFEDIEIHDRSTDILLESIYRNLKLSAKNDNNEKMTSAWHYKEKEVQLRRLIHESFEIIASFIGKFRSNSTKKLLCSCKKEIPTAFTTLFETVVLFIYSRISGFGEKPLRAGIILLLLLFMPLLFPKPSNTLGHVKSWLFYIPFGKVDLPIPEQVNINAVCILLRMIVYVLITIQTTIFGFSLRNKFRR